MTRSLLLRQLINNVKSKEPNKLPHPHIVPRKPNFSSLIDKSVFIFVAAALKTPPDIASTPFIKLTRIRRNHLMFLDKITFLLWGFAEVLTEIGLESIFHF